MSNSLEKQAEKLAAQRYFVIVTHDETTQGEPILVLSHPELPGCLAQGETFEEAWDNLEDVRKDYILSLLEDGLPVPPPSETQTTAGDTATINVEVILLPVLMVPKTERSELLVVSSPQDYVPSGDSLTQVTNAA